MKYLAFILAAIAIAVLAQPEEVGTAAAKVVAAFNMVRSLLLAGFAAVDVISH